MLVEFMDISMDTLPKAKTAIVVADITQKTARVKFKNRSVEPFCPF
jgi:hypothetical protein